MLGARLLRSIETPLARPFACRQVTGWARSSCSYGHLIWPRQSQGALAGCRMFSSNRTLHAPFKIYERPPSLLGRIWALTPQPIKTFAYVSLGAATLVLLAPGFLLFVLPPLLVGLFYARRSMRRAQDLLYNQRWSSMSNFPFMKAESTGFDSIPYTARARVYDAISTNEQGLGTALGVDPDKITYTGVESLSQDIKQSADGTVNTLLVQKYGMLSDNSRVATMTLVIQIDQKQDDLMKMQVEIKPNWSTRTYRLDAERGRGENIIIDIKK